MVTVQRKNTVVVGAWVTIWLNNVNNIANIFYVLLNISYVSKYEKNTINNYLFHIIET